jgi:REP element-mobilizing transposase RayT
MVIKGLPKRKYPRLKNFDYSENGYYFVTICTDHNQPILSRIMVGRGLAPAKSVLSPLGLIVEQQLLALSERFSDIMIDRFVVMPTHLHVVIALNGETAAGATPRPTLSDIICVFKSITTRLCNQHDNIPGRKIWQTSFYDEILRNEAAYLEVLQYIENNPAEWSEDKYFME